MRISQHQVKLRNHIDPLIFQDLNLVVPNEWSIRKHSDEIEWDSPPERKEVL